MVNVYAYVYSMAGIHNRVLYLRSS